LINRLNGTSLSKDLSSKKKIPDIVCEAIFPSFAECYLETTNVQNSIWY